MLHADRNPCTSCPYRRDTPSGLWHRDEYEKLRAYDGPEIDYDRARRAEPTAGVPHLAVFLCHHSQWNRGDTVCRGWLTVHADSVAVRLAILQGQIAVGQRDAPVSAPLHASGNEAADAGQRAIRRPGKRARRMIDGLVRRRSRG